MFKKVMMILMALAFVAGTATADITHAPFMFNAMDATGAAIENGTFVMVVDLDSDGWDGIDYAAQSLDDDNASAWLWDAQDLILNMGQITNGEAFPFGKVASNAKPAGMDASDEVYLLWFDVEYNAAAEGPGADVNYGAEMIGVVGADPGDYTPFANGGNAGLVTVPEPASVLMVLTGAAMLISRRR